MLKIEMQKINAILKVEHALKQCAHIVWKRGWNHLQNHLGQSSFIKGHTLYPTGHQKKDVVNKPRQR
jgi:hypothetical protein